MLCPVLQTYKYFSFKTNNTGTANVTALSFTNNLGKQLTNSLRRKRLLYNWIAFGRKLVVEMKLQFMASHFNIFKLTILYFGIAYMLFKLVFLFLLVSIPVGISIFFNFTTNYSLNARYFSTGTNGYSLLSISLWHSLLHT